ncbi:MAG: FAD:protein FMN transferase [Ignavibacteria bacterium]|nr:FAD:protein FMN transferase [Ignavibacteria bacterium]
MWKRISAVIFIILLFIAGYYFGNSCDRGNNITKRTKIILGTTVEIIFRDYNENRSNLLFKTVFSEFNRIDSLFSAYIPGNPVYNFNNSENDTIILGKEIIQLLKLSGEMNSVSRGGFDVALGRLNDVWGFNGLTPAVPTDESLKKALDESGWKHIEILNDSIIVKHKNVHLNFNAIAKGYAVDRAFELLKNSGAEEFLINAGGEIRAAGKKWNIGIQDPDNRNLLIKNLKPEEITNEISVATSGDYENYFMKDNIRYHHILDPVSGFPSRKFRSVTIIAKDVTTADALSTGIFVNDAEKGLEIVESLQGVECLIIDINGEYIMSSGFGKYIR